MRKRERSSGETNVFSTDQIADLNFNCASSLVLLYQCISVTVKEREIDDKRRVGGSA